LSYQLAELVRVSKGRRHEAAVLDPAAERLLAGAEVVIDQLLKRDPHIDSGHIHQEHQPRQPGGGGGVELQLGVRHLLFIPYPGAVAGAEHTHIYVACAHTLGAYLCDSLIGGGKVGHIHDHMPSGRDRPLHLSYIGFPASREFTELGSVRDEYPPPDIVVYAIRASHPHHAPRRYIRATKPATRVSAVRLTFHGSAIE
jgi:hypothetical protein